MTVDQVQLEGTLSGLSDHLIWVINTIFRWAVLV